MVLNKKQIFILADRMTLSTFNLTTLLTLRRVQHASHCWRCRSLSPVWPVAWEEILSLLVLFAWLKGLEEAPMPEYCASLSRPSALW